MASPRPWTNDEIDDFTRRNANGESLHSIAKVLGRSKGSVSAKAVALGLTWDRTSTAKAAQAHATDAKARRAALQLSLLGDAERLRAEIWEPHEYVDHGGREFIEVRWTTRNPAIIDKLKLMQAAGIAIDKSLRLAEYDTGGAENVRSLLAGMAQQLGLAPADQEQ